MLWDMLIAIVTGILAIKLYKQSDVGMGFKEGYKLGGLALGIISIFFLYQVLFYWNVGEDMRVFYNGGYGSVYSYVDDTNSTVMRTFYSYQDTRVGEYFATIKADQEFINVMSGVLPILMFAVVLAVVYFYINWAYFNKTLQLPKGKNEEKED